MWFKRLTTKSAEIVPETLEDILFTRLYLGKGDLISAKTLRTIKIEKSFPKEVEKERKSVIITIKVEDIYFGMSFDTLTVDGEIEASSDENISLGSRHVMEICPGTKFLLMKCDGEIDFNLLRESLKQDQFMVVSIDSMIAGIGEIKGSRVSYITEVQSNYQGKLYEAKREPNSVFFDKILKIIFPYLNEIKKILVSGPGSLKLVFKNYIESSNLDKKLQVVVLEGVDVAGFDGIRMVLNSENFSKVLRDNFFSKARSALAKVLESLYKGDGLASASLEEIEYMSINGACDSLLVSKDYLSKSPADEKKIVQIFSNLAKYKGSLYLMDDNTNVGIQLGTLGGIVALFRYRIK